MERVWGVIYKLRTATDWHLPVWVKLILLQTLRDKSGAVRICSKILPGTYHLRLASHVEKSLQ